MQTMSLKIEQPYFVVCEDLADKNTYSALVKENNLLNIFQFECSGGKDGFWRLLLALPSLVGAEDLKGIVLLQDTDDNSNEALKDLKRQLKQANKEHKKLEHSDIISLTNADDFLIPFIGGFLTISNKKIPILFASVPFGEPGCIETLILSAAASKYPKYQSCLNQYEACCGINDWRKTKKDKMRLACLVAAVCGTDPTVSVSSMWYAKHGFKSLLTNHESFGKIIDFFKNVPEIISQPQTQMCLNSSEFADLIGSDCV